MEINVIGQRQVSLLHTSIVHCALFSEIPSGLSCNVVPPRCCLSFLFTNGATSSDFSFISLTARKLFSLRFFGYHGFYQSGPNPHPHASFTHTGLCGTTHTPTCFISTHNRPSYISKAVDVHLIVHSSLT